MNAAKLKQLGETLSAIAEGAEWECQWEDGWAHPNGRDVEYCIANRVPIRLKQLTPFESNCHMLGVDLTDEKAYHEAINELLKATYALMTNPHADLGDMIYKVRESADGNWDAPEVVSWGESVSKLNAIFSAYNTAMKP
jgi:hypothetical protein